MIPFTIVQPAIRGADHIHTDTQYGSKSCHRVKTAAEPEHKLIQIGGQMLLADAVVSSHHPSLQIRESDVDHRQVGIGFLKITGDVPRFTPTSPASHLPVPPRKKDGIISAHNSGH